MEYDREYAVLTVCIVIVLLLTFLIFWEQIFVCVYHKNFRVVVLAQSVKLVHNYGITKHATSCIAMCDVKCCISFVLISLYFICCNTVCLWRERLNVPRIKSGCLFWSGWLSFCVCVLKQVWFFFFIFL